MHNIIIGIGLVLIAWGVIEGIAWASAKGCPKSIINAVYAALSLTAVWVAYLLMYN